MSTRLAFPKVTWVCQELYPRSRMRAKSVCLFEPIKSLNILKISELSHSLDKGAKRLQQNVIEAACRLNEPGDKSLLVAISFFALVSGMTLCYPGF